MRTIQLTGGKVTTVDDEDYPLVAQYKWSYHRGYAIGWVDGRQVYMHRLLLNLKQGELVDHIDHDGLNNRRNNIAVVSRGTNKHNTETIRRVSPYRGVKLLPNGKASACVYYDNGAIYLGTFRTPEDAATAYDSKVRELYGKHALCNFQAVEGEAA